MIWVTSLEKSIKNALEYIIEYNAWIFPVQVGCPGFPNLMLDNFYSLQDVWYKVKDSFESHAGATGLCQSISGKTPKTLTDADLKMIKHFAGIKKQSLNFQLGLFSFLFCYPFLRNP